MGQHKQLCVKIKPFEKVGSKTSSARIFEVNYTITTMAMLFGKFRTHNQRRKTLHHYARKYLKKKFHTVNPPNEISNKGKTQKLNIATLKIDSSIVEQPPFHRLLPPRKEIPLAYFHV